MPPAVKGFRLLWSLHKAFKCFDQEVFRILYPTYLRHNLEYYIQDASPYWIRNVDILCVQRVGTKLAIELYNLQQATRSFEIPQLPYC